MFKWEWSFSAIILPGCELGTKINVFEYWFSATCKVCNHRMAEVGRGFWRSSSATPCLNRVTWNQVGSGPTGPVVFTLTLNLFFEAILKTEMLQAPWGLLPFCKSISPVMALLCGKSQGFVWWGVFFVCLFFLQSQFDQLSRRETGPLYSYWELDKNFRLVALRTRFCCWKGSCSSAKLLADTAPRLFFSKNLNCSFQCSYSKSYMHTPARAGVLPAMYF